MSIWKKVDAIIDEHIGLTDIGKDSHYTHIESCQKLCGGFDEFMIGSLLNKIFTQIEGDLKDSNYDNPSEQNWRWEKKKEISYKNKSEETRLEKAIVKETSSDWVNQIPIASGLISPGNGKQACIDIAHKIDEGEYEFIELKVKNHTPLAAAMQITKYGLFYISARRNGLSQDKELMKAKKIHLLVLAPRDFYNNYDLAWMQEPISNGLQGLIQEYRINDLHIDFNFAAFPEDFVSCKDGKFKPELKEALKKIEYYYKYQKS